MQRASWWSLHVGSLALESSSTDYDGLAYGGEAVAVSSDGFGARLAFDHIGTEDSEMVWDSVEFAVLLDYARGGRFGLRLKDTTFSLQLAPGIYVHEETVEYGLSWTHVVEVGDMGVNLELSVMRAELTSGDGTDESFQLGDRTSQRMSMYMVKEFGVVLFAEQERREIKDTDAYGGGLALDMEQVGLMVEYRRTDNHRDHGDSSESLQVLAQIRF
jgi:hypothetical protein